jgi:hypothetical protein
MNIKVGNRFAIKFGPTAQGHTFTTFVDVIEIRGADVILEDDRGQHIRLQAKTLQRELAQGRMRNIPNNR